MNENREKALYHLERYFRYVYAGNSIPQAMWLAYSCKVKVDGDIIDVTGESLVPMMAVEEPSGGL